MKTDRVYRSDELNISQKGVLKSQRFFSQGDFYDAERIQFGTLRLLNNNYYTVGSANFVQQHHSDLEVVLIPLTGAIEYADSKSNRCIISKGEFIVVSTGLGIQYAINSASPKEEVNYLKIWVLPKKKGMTPRHHVGSIDMDMTSNRFNYIISPDSISAESATLNQDAWIALAQIDPKSKVTYHKKKWSNGVFIRVCQGDIKVGGHKLYEGDCIAFDDKNDLVIEGVSKNLFLLLEIPMDVTLYNSDEIITIPPKM